MGLLNKDNENEVSGGQVFGYILIGLAVAFIIAFLVFVGIQKFSSNNNEDNQTQVESSIEMEEQIE